MATNPLFATRNIHSNSWKLTKGRLDIIRRLGREDVIALDNAKRIGELGEGDEVKGLQQGMRILGYSPKLDPTNHLQRELVAPTKERDF